MPEAQLHYGPIEYNDTGGDGPIVLLVGGLLIGSSLWDQVVAELRSEFRCIIPALPWGAHRQAMQPETDLSLAGQARILTELVEHLRLEQVTLVESDSAMAQVVMAGNPQHIARVVFVSCETWSNYPPGLPGRLVTLAATIPGGLYLAMQQMRLHAFQRSPLAFGRMAKHGISEQMLDSWLHPVITQSGVRRDLAKYARSVRASRQVLKAAMNGLATLSCPALVVWAAEDRVMPLATGRELAAAIPSSRFVEIEDSYTLVALDQPARLAREIRLFASSQRAGNLESEGNRR
jgi:pimeloyl-ACP methyl ester carboxylesterase